jgi:hypothetical protein
MPDTTAAISGWMLAAADGCNVLVRELLLAAVGCERARAVL